VALTTTMGIDIWENEGFLGVVAPGVIIIINYKFIPPYQALF
jgi:hypothetical protein